MKKQTKFGLVLAAAAVISVSVASLVSARGWVQQGADWYYVDNNGEYVTDTIQSSGNAKFYLGENGAMQRDYFLEDYNENAYYFGNNGAMVTNTWVAIESSRVDNQDDYVPDNYWYYFQASGKALKAASGSVKKTTIDGKKYAFNQYGQMLTEWFGSDGVIINPDDESNPFENALYYAGGDNDGVLRAGWLTYYDGYDGDGEPETEYTNLYFYFNTSNNKKYGNNDDGAVYKKINGRNYAFNQNGVMYSGWDVYDNGNLGIGSLSGKTTYFSGEDDGHQVKKGWVYAVPSENIDSKKYNDDEEVYMYFSGSGDIVSDQFKKVNGKYYAFAENGVMKTGLIIWCPAGTTNESIHYVSKVDLDYANGDDIAKKGFLQTDSNEFIQINPSGDVIDIFNDTYNGIEPWLDTVKLHYHGSDGARRTGQNTVEFNDTNYTFSSNGSGNKDSGTSAKKYYVMGLQLKASTDVRYGIYNTADWMLPNYPGPFDEQSGTGKVGVYTSTGYLKNLRDNNYIVLTTGGAKQKGSNGSKKDADGNYWLISKDNDGALKGIWTVEVHEDKGFGVGFETRTVKNTVPGLEHNDRFWGIATLAQLGLAVENANDDLDNTEWRAIVDRGTVKFKLVSKTGFSNTLSFKSDYADKTNKWIPAGLLDNAGKTVSIEYDENMDPRTLDYMVTPTNDYFVNCIWYSAQDPAGNTWENSIKDNENTW
jgi:hypothetical protein